MRWLLTCEHYGNAVPLKYDPLFEQGREVLESHRGYDLNIASTYELLKPMFDAQFKYDYSRLLIEPNRSLHHRSLFSPFTTQLERDSKTELIHKYYMPYRNDVEHWIRSNIDDQIFHLSVHSFTPNFGNQDRSSPLGILFDSRKSSEKAIAKIFRQCLRETFPDDKTRFNYPYRGNADGFTTYLRKVFPQNYLGFELEIRNDCVGKINRKLPKAIGHLQATL